MILYHLQTQGVFQLEMAAFLLNHHVKGKMYNVYYTFIHRYIINTNTNSFTITGKDMSFSYRQNIVAFHFQLEKVHFLRV